MDVKAPVRRQACISEKTVKGHIKETASWRIFSKRYSLNPTVEENLEFAMRYEALDLLVLKRIFLALPPKVVADYVQSAPTSIYTRRAWYLFELLTQTELKNHSAPLMEFIEWIPTPEGNVQVTSDTIDLYRYIDCTQESEFLYSCVERTIRKDLPNEVEFLTRRDEAIYNIMNIVEMPDRTAEQFVHYVQKNDGKLAKRRRKEFEALTDTELDKLENTVRRVFKGFVV